MVPSRTFNINGTGIVEKTFLVNERLSSAGYGIFTTERVDGVRKGINSIGIVERLGTKNLEKSLLAFKRSTVVNILIRLNNPDKLFNGVVKVELDLVTGRTDRFITSELELLDEILVRVLGHSASLVGVKEDIVDIKRSSNKRLVVGSGYFTRTGAFGTER